MEERQGITIKGLLVRLILIIIFIFLLIWLFPMPDLKPLNNQIFSDNLDRMKNVAKTYYTVDRLPKDINDSKRMSLREMIDAHLIMPLMDSNGKYCSNEDSYVEITKLEDEYVIKVYLSCSDKKDYIIEHFGCYDICSDTCKLLETTTSKKIEEDRKTTLATTYRNKTTNRVVTTKKKTTLTSKVTTHSCPTCKDIYEYQFVKNICTQDFEKFTCPVGYELVADSCIKENAKTLVEKAEEKEVPVTSTDSLPAKEKTVYVDDNGNIIDAPTDPENDPNAVEVPAVCEEKTITRTEDATATPKEVDATKTTVTTEVTADAIDITDTKAAVASSKKEFADYITAGNYDKVTATKVATSSRWVYDYVTISTSSNLGYENENEKLEYVSSFEELECSTCFTTVKKYKYRHAYKEYEYSYTCSSGYHLEGNYCISDKPVSSSKVCPQGYNPDGKQCSKKVTYYDESNACSKYGSGYKLNKSKGTCVKTSTSYNCPQGKPTKGGKSCLVDTVSYECPATYSKTSNEKRCSKTIYSCPADTNIRTYTLNGTKCTMKMKVDVCGCPSGTIQSSTDKSKCYKLPSTKKIMTCEDYPDGYVLTDKNTCVKTTVTTKKVLSCEKYGDDYLLNEKDKTCVKTINEKETIPADKQYKVSCRQEYIWTTQTEVDGWSYTGNKRLVK